MLCAGQNFLARPATVPFTGAGSGAFFPALPGMLSGSGTRIRHHEDKAKYEDQEPQVLGVVGDYDGTKVFASARRFFMDATNSVERLLRSPETQSALQFASSNAVLIPVVGAVLLQSALAVLPVAAQLATVLPAAPAYPDATAMYLEQLGSSDSTQRKSAIEALAPYAATNPQIKAALLRKLDDGDIFVRVTVVRSLAGLISDRDVKSLFQWHLRPYPGAYFEHEALVHAIDGITDYELKREMYLHALSIFYNDAEIDNRDDHGFRRLYIVNDHALKFLEGHFYDDRSAAEVLIKSLAHQSTPVSNEAGRFLEGKFSDSRVMQGFLNYGTKSPSETVRLQSISLLRSFIGMPEVSRGVADMLADSSDKVVAAAIGALTPILDSDREKFLAVYDMSSISEKRPTVKSAAARALASIEPANKPLSSRVEGLLKDENRGVRIGAAFALLPRAGEPQIRAKILAAMSGYDTMIYGWGNVFKDKMDDPQVVGILVDFFEEKLKSGKPFHGGEEDLVGLLTPAQVMLPGVAELLVKLVINGKTPKPNDYMYPENRAAKIALSLLTESVGVLDAKRNTTLFSLLLAGMPQKIGK